MTISISDQEAMSIAEAINDIQATEKQIKNAYHQSVGKAVRLSSNRVAHDIANQLDIPLKLIRKRIFVYKTIVTKGSWKIWAGLNDLPIDKLGRPKRIGADVVVKGITASNAYITKSGYVRLRESGQRATVEIDEQAENLLQKLLPYYFYQYFEKEFQQLLKFKYGVN
ncbi:hypothetical protein L3V83_13630 [Thiotrichales bacterium 19X7-9]|nr:hypothetical protein [Thiotrichales bacterium 19X7-9]